MPARTRAETMANLEGCYGAIEDLIGSLAPADWEVRSLCPDWDVRGVLTHLIGIEHVLLGWRPTSTDDPLPFDALGDYLRQTQAWSTDRLVTETGELFAGRRAELAGLTDEEFAAPCPTPVGPADYHRFMDIRVFDLWVHERDITTPLGRATDDGGPAAEATIDEIEASIGYIVGRKVGLPDGMSVAFHLTGPVTRDILVLVDGRAGRVDRLDDPSVEVTADSLTFTQLACGRIDPQGAIDAGRISWTGDAEWGDRAARSLAFTM